MMINTTYNSNSEPLIKRKRSGHDPCWNFVFLRAKAKRGGKKGPNPPPSLTPHQRDFRFNLRKGNWGLVGGGSKALTG